MKIVYLLLTILLGLHFFITFGLLLLSYYKDSKHKKAFFIVLIMNVLFFLIWGFLRNVDPPFWA
jgi:succinate dehydrogenase hydrophobic anchor subunit